MNKQDRTIIYQKTFNTKEGKEVIKDILNAVNWTRRLLKHDKSKTCSFAFQWSEGLQRVVFVVSVMLHIYYYSSNEYISIVCIFMVMKDNVFWLLG